MTNSGGGRDGINHLSWQHTAIYASADVAKLLLISGGFVASMYIWRETRGPLCAFLPTVGLAEAATNLQYYYDRDNPQNIKKRCWSIAGVAVVGLGYLLIDEAKRATAAAADATGFSSSLCAPSSSTALSAAVGHAAEKFCSLSFSATKNMIKTYFVNPRLMKDVVSATLVTSTLFAGVIATKIYFPRERDLMPECSSSSENEEEEGGEDSYAKKDGLDNFNFGATRESSPTDRFSHQLPTPRAGLGLGAAGSAGSRADLASFGGGWGGGRPRSTYASMDEMGGAGGHSTTTSHNYSGTNIAHFAGESPRSRVGGTVGAPSSNTRASTASQPLRVAREVSRELRALRQRRRKWKILRNLVFAPFVEEIVFRAVMIRVLDNSVITYPSFVRFFLLAFGFSIAHTHHIVLYAVRSYQNNFDPLEDEEEQSRNAWESGAKATLAQVVVTGVFTYLNTFIFTSVAHNNVIAASLSHAFCNYLGPPSLAYRYYPPTPTEFSSGGEERDKSSSPTEACGTTQPNEGGANKKLKKTRKKGYISTVLRGLKRVFRPSRVEHSLKIKLITASYGAGVVGFFGLVFAYRRQALGK